MCNKSGRRLRVERQVVRCCVGIRPAAATNHKTLVFFSCCICFFFAPPARAKILVETGEIEMRVCYESFCAFSRSASQGKGCQYLSNISCRSQANHNCFRGPKKTRTTLELWILHRMDLRILFFTVILLLLLQRVFFGVCQLLC